jgi:hypothetical protein
MWVDIDDVRTEIRRLESEIEEEFAGRRNCNTLHYGMLVGCHKVEVMLEELEEVYRKQGLEHIRSLREEQHV